MGDAAHCHLPTSAQGACQAVEDAAVVAMCLERSKGDVELALQVFQRIRFNRSHVIHQASISTRNIYHQHDWTPEYVAKHPGSLVIPLFDWITEYDVYKEVDAHFDHLAEDVRRGKQGTIEQLALPAGGNYDEMEITAKKEGFSGLGSKPSIVTLEASSVQASISAMLCQIISHVIFGSQSWLLKQHAWRLSIASHLYRNIMTEIFSGTL